MWWAATILLLAPFLVVTLPPLTDLGGHLAHFAVQLDGGRSADLARFYSFHWDFVPDLGTDILVQEIAPVLGLDRSTWLVTALIPLTTGLGISAVSRAATGRVQPGCAWAFLYIYSYPLAFGFLNYCLSVGLALIAFALWIALANRMRLRAAVALVSLAVVLTCHLIGWAILTILIGGYELGLVLEAQDGRRRAATLGRAVPGLFARLWPVALVGIIYVAWAILSAHGQSGEGIAYLDGVWRWKLRYLLWVLRDQNMLLDLLTPALTVVAAGIALRSGARLRTRFLPALVVLALCVLLLPSKIGGGALADMRLVPLLPLLFFACLDFHDASQRGGVTILVTGLCLFGLRIATTTAGWRAYEVSWQRDLSGLQHIKTGGRVLVFTHWPCHEPWREDRVGHIPTIAIARRHAWVSNSFAKPGLQLLGERYVVLGGFGDLTVPSTTSLRACDPSGSDTVASHLKAVTPGAADYLWLAGFSAGERGGIGLPLLWSSENSALYALGR